MDTVLDAIAKAKKVIPPLVGAAAIIFGTDSSVLADVVAVLVALGVYAVPNAE